MQHVLKLLILTLAITPLLGMSWLDSYPQSDAFLSSRDETHNAVLALEADPLHKNAEMARAVLVVHYKENVDYIVCGTVLGPMTENQLLAPAMWQIVIAAGDWVEANPDRAKDIDAYTLAGLESGVRVYQRLLASDAGARYALMDELSKEYERGTLDEWNRAHPCTSE